MQISPSGVAPSSSLMRRVLVTRAWSLDSRPFFRRLSRSSSTKRVFISWMYREAWSTTVAKSSPDRASSWSFRAMSISPAEAEQELNTWTRAPGCSSSHRALAWAAALWEPESRADRVTT